MEAILKLQNSTASCSHNHGPELTLQVFSATEHISASLRFLFVCSIVSFHSIDATFRLIDRINLSNLQLETACIYHVISCWHKMVLQEEQLQLGI